MWKDHREYIFQTRCPIDLCRLWNETWQDYKTYLLFAVNNNLNYLWWCNAYVSGPWDINSLPMFCFNGTISECSFIAKQSSQQKSFWDDKQLLKLCALGQKNVTVRTNKLTWKATGASMFLLTADTRRQCIGFSIISNLSEMQSCQFHLLCPSASFFLFTSPGSSIGYLSETWSHQKSHL